MSSAPARNLGNRAQTAAHGGHPRLSAEVKRVIEQRVKPRPHCLAFPIISQQIRRLTAANL
jgi:hypothetical protein